MSLEQKRRLPCALNLSHGSMWVFIQRPISATLLSVIALMSIYVGIRTIRGKKTVRVFSHVNVTNKA